MTPRVPPVVVLRPRVAQLVAPVRATAAFGEVVYRFGVWKQKQQRRSNVRATRHAAQLLERGLTPESLAALRAAGGLPSEVREPRGPAPAVVPLPEEAPAVPRPFRTNAEPLAALLPEPVPTAPMAAVSGVAPQQVEPPAVLDPMSEVLLTPPSSPEAEPVSKELPGSGVPRTPPYRAPAASSSSVGPCGSASPDQWSPVLRPVAVVGTVAASSTSRSVSWRPWFLRRRSSLRSCGRTFQGKLIRISLAYPGTTTGRARARERARTLLAEADHELLDARRGSSLRQRHGVGLPRIAVGVRLSLLGAKMRGTVRVGFGAHKIWGS